MVDHDRDHLDADAADNVRDAVAQDRVDLDESNSGWDVQIDFERLVDAAANASNGCLHINLFGHKQCFDTLAEEGRRAFDEFHSLVYHIRQIHLNHVHPYHDLHDDLHVAVERVQEQSYCKHVAVFKV